MNSEIDRPPNLGGEAPASDPPRTVSPPSDAPTGELTQSRGFSLREWAAIGSMLLALAAVALYVQNRMGRSERDLARRLQTIEVREQQFEQQVKLLGDTLREAQGKAAVVEAKLADTLGQQAQLRQLYEQMALSRGDAMLGDVENAVMIASQQLQLGGNVPSALLALQDADQVLSRSNQPALIGLRRHLARDIERLKAMPLNDFAAAVSKLDAVIALADQLPLVADINLRGRAEPGVIEPARSGLLGLPERVARTSLQGWEGFIAEMRQLVRVQRLDQPEALLLSPDQRFFARENLRLLLLNARLNLLARNEALFRGDIERATRAIDRWFDVNQRPVVSALASMRQLQSTSLSLQMPSLAETAAAVRAARAAGDAR
jgi:uroporphyrin-3 C-methyltransferase/uroporphyrinogen III methyltransferase/synthase